MVMPRSTENTALFLYQLIGAPLHALIEAESQASQATADFIERVGFIKTAVPPEAGAAPPTTPAGEEYGQLRMVTFRYQRPGPDGTPQTYRIDVPLLSLVPIPALQIKDANLQFAVRIVDITAAGPRLAAAAGSPPEGAPGGVGGAPVSPDRVDFKAVVGREAPADPSQRRSTDMQIRMSINVIQADVPAGMSRLFNLMEQAIVAQEERPGHAPPSLAQPGQASPEQGPSSQPPPAQEPPEQSVR